MRKKTGKSFERLIARIQKCVHERAAIGVDEKLEDIDTGRPRQVDITIRLSDGPTNFLGIVEVRDRSRPIGVRYIEEIFGKQRSVRADAAFIVSKSGFTGTAIVKANQLAIRVLTYEEAQEADWSNWLQCRTFSVLSRKWDKPVVTPFQQGEKSTTIDIPLDCLAQIAEDKSSKVILDKDGNPLLSFPELLSRIINAFGERAYEGIPEDGTRVNKRLFYNGLFEPPLYLRTKGKGLCQIGNVGLEVELFMERKEYPITLARYKGVDSKNSIAELATADIDIHGEKYRFEILAPGAGDFVPAGASVTFQSIPLSKEGEQKNQQ